MKTVVGLLTMLIPLAATARPCDLVWAWTERREQISPVCGRAGIAGLGKGTLIPLSVPGKEFCTFECFLEF